MAGIFEYYMKEFVPGYENTEIVVDISCLIEISCNCSPFVLEYSSKEQFERYLWLEKILWHIIQCLYDYISELAIAITVNFCKTYEQTKLFPKKGIVALTSVLNKSDAVQRTLMLHLTKMISNDVAFASFLFHQADMMIIKSAPSEDELQWKSLATKVIRHEQVNRPLISNILIRYM